MMSLGSSQGIQRSTRSLPFSLKSLVYLLLLCLFIYSAFVTTNLQRNLSALSTSLPPSILHQAVADHVIDADTGIPIMTSRMNDSQQVDKRLLVDEEYDMPVCRVVLVNKADYHYEIIESTILQYPLPWEKLGCNMTANGNKKPIIAFDVALAEHHTFGNEKEGWIDYFNTSLKGKVQNRTDGLVRAQFGDIVSYSNFTHSYSAQIGVTCGSARSLKRWMKGPNGINFCVRHIMPKIADLPDSWVLERSCFLTPMHHEQCFFLPTDFPQFESTQQKSQATTLNLCVSGANRHHASLAQVLAEAPWNVTQSVRLHLLQRHPNIPKDYTNQHLPNMVDIIRIDAFLEFQKAISECNVLLPLIDPENNVHYFPQGLKKLTGSIPQAIAYKLPTVMHVELYNIYKDYLTAPSRTYTNMTSFATALNEMISLLSTA